MKRPLLRRLADWCSNDDRPIWFACYVGEDFAQKVACHFLGHEPIIYYNKGIPFCCYCNLCPVPGYHVEMVGKYWTPVKDAPCA